MEKQKNHMLQPLKQSLLYTFYVSIFFKNLFIETFQTGIIIGPAGVIMLSFMKVFGLDGDCYGEGGFCVFMGFRLKLMLMLKVVKR